MNTKSERNRSPGVLRRLRRSLHRRLLPGSHHSHGPEHSGRGGRGLGVVPTVAGSSVLALLWARGPLSRAGPRASTTATAKTGAVREKVAEPATVDDVDQADVNSDISGDIESVDVQAGDYVYADETLAATDSLQRRCHVVRGIPRPQPRRGPACLGRVRPDSPVRRGGVGDGPAGGHDRPGGRRPSTGRPGDAAGAGPGDLSNRRNRRCPRLNRPWRLTPVH